MCVSPNLGGSEMSRLWVGIGGSEKNWLWCMANGMPGKQRYSKCSKWPPSARVHASGLFCHWSTVSSTMLCWNSAHVATRCYRSATRPYSELVLDTREKMKKMKNLCNFYKVVGRHFKIINSTSGLVHMCLSDCDQKRQVTTAPRTLPWWRVWWRSVEDCNSFHVTNPLTQTNWLYNALNCL